MAQVALAWSLSKAYITAPVVGTTSLEKLQELVGKFGSSLEASWSLLMASMHSGRETRID